MLLNTDSRSLDTFLERLASTNGPFVIVARPHSGTRALANIFSDSGIYMGANISQYFSDNEDWYHRFTFPLISSDYFPNWDVALSSEKFSSKLREYLSDTLVHYFSSLELIQPELTWGWKLSECIFLMPLIKQYFPGAKFIHLIRDGRDIVLSDSGLFQLTRCQLETTLGGKIKERIKRLIGLRLIDYAGRKHKKFCLNVTFNNDQIKSWDGINLFSSQALHANKYQIQMQSWLNCIQTGRAFAHQFPESYYELKYEDLCRTPVQEIINLFSFLDIDATGQTLKSLANRFHMSSIQKWRSLGPGFTGSEDFRRAVELGTPLLRDLGYLDEV